jgi:flagellar biosynthesis GTPase FlhF
MFGILEAVTVPHTGIYGSYEELITELNNRVSKDGYKIVKSRSHRGRVGGAGVPNNEMVRCDLVCDKGGRPYKCMATKHKTHTKKTDCPWRAKAVHRKTIGGWVLTITCDQHNHEPGTPDPPSPVAPVSEMEDNDESALDATPSASADAAQPDNDTSVALQLAGVSNTALRLTGETFHQIKSEYRKMAQHERLSILSQMQLRIAAIYAVQNEDVQRNQRSEAQKRRHSEIEEGRKPRQSNKQKTRRQNQQTQQNQQNQQPQAQQDQLTPQPQQAQPQQQQPQQQQPQQVQQPQQSQQQIQQQAQQAQQLQQAQARQAQQAQQQLNQNQLQHQGHHQQPQQQSYQHQQHQGQIAHQPHQMQQGHMGQPQYPMSAPDSPGQQLLSMSMAQIQHYNGPASTTPTPPANKRARGRPSQAGQQTA